MAHGCAQQLKLRRDNIQCLITQKFLLFQKKGKQLLPVVTFYPSELLSRMQVPEILVSLLKPVFLVLQMQAGC